MKLKIGEMEMNLVHRRSSTMMVGGELREMLALDIDPAGVSMDALWEAMTPDACASAEVDGEPIGNYRTRVSMARQAGSRYIMLRLSKPTEGDELRESIAILTGEAE